MLSDFDAQYGKLGFNKGEKEIFDQKKQGASIGKGLKNYQSQPKFIILGVCWHFWSNLGEQYSKIGVSGRRN